MKHTMTDSRQTKNAASEGTSGSLCSIPLRDFLAAHALTGLLPARDPQGRSAFTEMDSQEVSESAYRIADMMLAVRESNAALIGGEAVRSKGIVGQED